MFNKLPLSKSDPILDLITAYRKDSRTDKIDVGVGVFKDETGNTPVVAAVREAERQLVDTQTTKSYVGATGNESFNTAMIDLVFSDQIDLSRIKSIQTPGGSGALKISAEMLSETTRKTIWISDPTWGNHRPIFETSGLGVKTYPYLNTETKSVDEEKMLEAISNLGKDDILLIHGCCHNPTGANLSFDAWRKVTELSNEKGFLPFVDLAYQGFGDGLEEDVIGLRHLAKHVEEMIITVSCSKNFGLYRERVGCTMVIAKDEPTATLAQQYLSNVARVTYSMPPDHGAEVVANILNDTSLRKSWEDELTTMRTRILSNRVKLSNTLKAISNSNRWDFIAEHRGMFSLLCLDQSQTNELVSQDSIYIVSGGRINIAGLKDDEQIARFCDCLHRVTNR